MTRPRAADNFATIRERMKELGREAVQTNAAENRRPSSAETLLTDRSDTKTGEKGCRRPPWVPTIFLAPPARLSPRFLPGTPRRRVGR